MKKRLFFGFEVDAPWPDSFPRGRVLTPEARHLTIIFLGDCDWDQMSDKLMHPPLPQFRVGRVGLFDKPLFLPKRKPRVASWHVKWLDSGADGYIDALRQHFGVQEGDFLPHVTISRGDFDPKEWKSAFLPLPMRITALHLYESLGHSTYRSLLQHPLSPPFEEVEHTADLAYRIRGASLEEVERHAQFALAFEFPPLLPFLTPVREEMGLVSRLNDLVRRADGEIGTPFKAVSFHGEIEERDGILEWEMIIDV